MPTKKADPKEQRFFRTTSKDQISDKAKLEEIIENKVKETLVRPKFQQQGPRMILQLDNTSWGVENVTLFSQIENVNSKRVFIDCVFGNMTYEHILKIVASREMKVNGMYIEVIDGKSNAASNEIRITWVNPFGELYEVTKKPYIDPNQFQPNITFIEIDATLDVSTKFDFTIPARTVIQVSIFTEPNKHTYLKV